MKENCPRTNGSIKPLKILKHRSQVNRELAHKMKPITEKERSEIKDHTNRMIEDHFDKPDHKVRKTKMIEQIIRT